MPTNRKRRTTLLCLLAFTLALISCDIPGLVAPPAVPTPLPPGAVNTIIAQTAQEAARETAALVTPSSTPTLVPLPTRTPTEPPTLTPTFHFVLPTFTITPTVEVATTDYACQLTDQKPQDNVTIAKNTQFVTSWTVKNTGIAVWDAIAVDFVFQSGTKLADVKAADLPASTNPGDSVTLKLTMTSPSSSGDYKTAWALKKGKDIFCRVSLSITVK